MGTLRISDHHCQDPQSQYQLRLTYSIGFQLPARDPNTISMWTMPFNMNTLRHIDCHVDPLNMHMGTLIISEQRWVARPTSTQSWGFCSLQVEALNLAIDSTSKRTMLSVASSIDSSLTRLQPPTRTRRAKRDKDRVKLDSVSILWKHFALYLPSIYKWRSISFLNWYLFLWESSPLPSMLLCALTFPVHRMFALEMS